MPLRNRATPLGEIVADDARGLVYANRGCLHDARGDLRRRFNGRRWIACRLRFRGRRRPLLTPGRYTELFFLDEATAMAAGHRACAECRRADYDRLREIWRSLHPSDRSADDVDARLHAERVGPDRRARLHPPQPACELPDGAYVLDEDRAWLVLGDALWAWTAAGYAQRRALPRAALPLITPPSLVEVLRAGWEPAVPLVHGSAAT